jgi:hypothetical protein
MDAHSDDPSSRHVPGPRTATGGVNRRQPSGRLSCVDGDACTRAIYSTADPTDEDIPRACDDGGPSLRRPPGDVHAGLHRCSRSDPEMGSLYLLAASYLHDWWRGEPETASSNPEPDGPVVRRALRVRGVAENCMSRALFACWVRAAVVRRVGVVLPMTDADVCSARMCDYARGMRRWRTASRLNRPEPRSATANAKTPSAMFSW